MHTHQEQAIDWIERSATLMAWAVTRQERKATYIGSLPREKTGLQCDCVCPACGGRLQAVNAGKPIQVASGVKTLRPHFRHDVGQQYDRCLLQVSQIVALQLLLQEKAIYLPPQSASWSAAGASGQIYTGTARSEGATMGIVSHQWVDEHEAKITLENGRVVWLRLFGTISSHNAAPEDAVITIKVDDPEVSTWSQEKILEHAQLTGKWLCWERHWQDEALAEAAKKDSEQQARHWCDYIPDDLELPAHLTHAQRSESVLHWVIKGILEAAKYLAVPGYDERLIKTMPDRTQEDYRVFFEERSYSISNARLEHRQHDVVPDVVCTASESGSQRMELMIEVTVTHGIDEIKAQRIRELGVACLEIDATRFGKSGKTSLDELRTMVLDDTKNKRWIFHPSIELRHQVGLDYLEKKKAAINRAIAEEKERDRWLESLTDQALLREYLGLLWQVWTGNTPIDSRQQTCPPEKLVPLLEKRGFSGMGHDIAASRYGLFWAVESIVQNDPQVKAALLFENAVTGTGRINLESYVTVLGAAIVEYEPSMNDHELMRMSELRQHVKHSIQRGDATYARPVRYDAALNTLYPRLRSRLESNKGTEAAVTRVRMAKMREQQNILMQEANQRRVTDAAQMNREELQLRIREVHLFHEWMPRAGWPHDLITTIKHVQQNMQRRDAEYDEFWTKLLMSAWDAREKRIELVDWVQSQNPKGAFQVLEIMKILEIAWMQKKTSTGR
jgi:hypothetical protein